MPSLGLFNCLVSPAVKNTKNPEFRLFRFPLWGKQSSLGVQSILIFLSMNQKNNRTKITAFVWSAFHYSANRNNLPAGWKYNVNRHCQWSVLNTLRGILAGPTWPYCEETAVKWQEWWRTNAESASTMTLPNHPSHVHMRSYSQGLISFCQLLSQSQTCMCDSHACL